MSINVKHGLQIEVSLEDLAESLADEVGDTDLVDFILAIDDRCADLDFTKRLRNALQDRVTAEESAWNRVARQSRTARRSSE